MEFVCYTLTHITHPYVACVKNISVDNIWKFDHEIDKWSLESKISLYRSWEEYFFETDHDRLMFIMRWS